MPSLFSNYCAITKLTHVYCAWIYNSYLGWAETNAISTGIALIIERTTHARFSSRKKEKENHWGFERERERGGIRIVPLNYHRQSWKVGQKSTDISREFGKGNGMQSACEGCTQRRIASLIMLSRHAFHVYFTAYFCAWFDRAHVIIIRDSLLLKTLRPAFLVVSRDSRYMCM